MHELEQIRACVCRKLDPACTPLRGVIADAERETRELLGFGQPQTAAMLTSAHWAPGKTLRIAFRGGTRAARRVVMAAALEWMKYANIDIVQVTSGACDIRCSFDPGGSWSYIGTEILSVPPDQPTMNIGWGPDMPTCLHELGHTLGLIHEHQNPQAKIPWDEPAVLAYYAGAPNFWPARQTIDNVLTVMDPRLLTNGGFDKHSIMEYPIPAELVTDPSFAVGWNTELSAGDKALIAGLYPGADA